MKKLLCAAMALTLSLSLFGCSAKEMTDLEYVQDNGKLIIGYTVYEPMNYEENGELTGFDTEFAIAVCEELGLEPEFTIINWDTKFVEVAGKSIDCIWNGMTITDDVKENIAVSDPYVLNAQVVVMKSGSDYTDTSSLAGKYVAAEQGSAGAAVVESDAGLSQAEFVGKSVQTDCLMEVAAGTVDAAVLDLSLANAMIGEGTNYSDLVIVDELEKEEYGIGFRQGSDLCDAVNEIMAEMKADGSLQALADKYDLALAD